MVLDAEAVVLDALVVSFGTVGHLLHRCDNEGPGKCGRPCIEAATNGNPHTMLSQKMEVSLSTFSDFRFSIFQIYMFRGRFVWSYEFHLDGKMISGQFHGNNYILFFFF
jgi:hypothetical protein